MFVAIFETNTIRKETVIEKCIFPADLLERALDGLELPLDALERALHRRRRRRDRAGRRDGRAARAYLAKLANLVNVLQNLGGLVLGCIKTKFCKKILKYAF